MFSGEHIIDLNRKNEIIIPRDFLKIIRDRGSKKLFMVPIQDFCLAVFEEGLDLNQISKDYPSFTKSEKWECNINSKNAMIIPQVLKEHIEIDDHVFIIGAGEFFEIWSPKGWERFHNSVRNDFAPAWAIMSKLSKRTLKKIARSGKLPKDVEKQISKATPNKDPEKLEHLLRVSFLKNKEQHMEILKSVNDEGTLWSFLGELAFPFSINSIGRFFKGYGRCISILWRRTNYAWALIHALILSAFLSIIIFAFGALINKIAVKISPFIEKMGS